MNNIQQASGKCLCGKVSVTAFEMDPAVSACHCGMCHKWSGGVAMFVHCGADVAWHGQEHIGVYSSSEWAERGFCKECGTHLFYRLKDRVYYDIPVSLFDDAKNLTFAAQIFIDKKPDYFAFANQTAHFTEAEIYAMFVGEE